MIYPDLITFWIPVTTYEAARKVPTYPRPSYPTGALVRNLDSAATAFLEGNVLSNPANVAPSKIETHYRVQLDTRRYRKIIAKMSKDFFDLETYGNNNNGGLKAAIDAYNAAWKAVPGNQGPGPFNLGNFVDGDSSTFREFVANRTSNRLHFGLGGKIGGPGFTDATYRSVTHLLITDIKLLFPDLRDDPDVINTRLAFTSASMRQGQTAEDVTNLLFTINSSALP